MYRIAFHLLESGRGINLEATGRISGDELAAANQHFSDSHSDRFLECEYWFSDYSQADIADITPTHARGIASTALVPHQPEASGSMGRTIPTDSMTRCSSRREI